MCCIEGNKSYIAINTVGDTCCIHCIHCAVCFVIVLADNYIELSLIGFDEGFHNFLTTSLCKITGLRIKNLPVIMLASYLIESFCTSKCCGSSYGTFDYKNVSVFIAKVLS